MHSGGGPPDKWYAFSTEGMTSPGELAAELSEAAGNGYLGEVVTVPSPTGVGTWVAVAGYKKS
jgi:hypothetical protein